MSASFETPRRLALTLFFVVIALFSQAASAADSELRQASEALLEGNFSRASSYAEAALESEPRSRLAHWLQAQSNIVLAGKPVHLRDSDKDFLQEARVRLEPTPTDRYPKNLVAMPRSAEDRVPVLLADASRSRLYVFGSKNGRPVLLDEFYTTIGLLGFDKRREGDQRTPIGVYRLEYEVRNPRGNPLLGDLAMTLDYPNALDEHAGRTGSGIWIHGVPKNVHVRPPMASDGCLALSNRDIERLRRYVRYNETQIVVVPSVEWIEKDVWVANAQRARDMFGFVASESRLGGIFYVDRGWPIVVAALRGNRVERREYFERSKSGLRRILVEKVGS